MVRINIQLKEISHYYGDQKAVNNVSLEIKKGELVALLGPSGCGKTTLLKLIAGLMPLEQGEIYLNENEISTWSVQKRNTAMVFQSYALFPHMTVEQNIEYGLKMRKLNKALRGEKVLQIMDKVQLSDYGKRKVQELSGGQQQRVALARALVVEPDVLLFDEPLSNLDEKLRQSMRKEIRSIQKELGITSVYVTHDQEEAMAIADRIVIMKDGEVQQIGTPNEVYERPKNKFVASFMGKCNFFEVQGCTRMCRPEEIVLSPDGSLVGRVEWIEYLGSIQQVTFAWEGQSLISESFTKQMKRYPFEIGDMIRFDFEFGDRHLSNLQE
ncbi:ABC transporter ATP-binding protein [Oceanirhabdus seepicola]|uniref:ABC-type quaternary amine transporter n=1 Tax=Oceanirhabdus seepicola TaxID=2828781 RepID=A0A9J6NW61_9CLOT|nr:ABC transporter ATP-binding protein [Oceanirhabdus seepicola]